jgi:hypothetical protein
MNALIDKRFTHLLLNILFKYRCSLVKEEGNNIEIVLTRRALN